MAKALVKENFVVGDILLFSEANNYSKNSNSILKTLVAGETITAGKPCFIADGSVFYEQINQTNVAGGLGSPIYAGTNLSGQTFRTKASPYSSVTLKEIQAYIIKSGTPSGNVTINIYAVDANHKPTGASLGSASITTASVSGANFYTFTFNLALSAGTEYAMVMSVPSGTGANYVSWYFSSAGGGVNIPEGFVIESSNSGSTWSTDGGADRGVKIKYSYIYGTTGRIYHSYAGDKNRSFFDCFAQENKTVGLNCVCQFGNLAEDLASLTIGDRYFLEDYHALVASITTGTDEDPIYTATWIGQTFTTAADQVAITKVVLDLARYNNVTGDVSISIRATSAGLPTGADLGVRIYPDSTMFQHTTYNTITVEFDTPIAVSPSTVYAVIVRVAGGDAANRIMWKSSSANPYASGQKVTSSNSGGSWTAVSGSDMRMEVYGYSKKVLATPVSYSILLGQALSATELFIEKEDHVIYKQTVSEANTSGAGSSCEASYDIPPRTKKIIINGTFTNGYQTGWNQLVLEIPHLVSAKVHDENNTNDLALTATITSNILTINSQLLSGTATFALDIIYIGR